MEIYLSGIIYTFLYVVLCKMFVEIFAKKNKKKSPLITWTFLTGLTICDYFVSILFVDSVFIKQLIIVLLGTFVMWVCYQIRFFKSTLVILFYQGLCFVTDYIAWMGLQKLIAATLVETTMLELFMGTLSQLLVFCLIIALRHRFAPNSAEALTNLEWTKFSIFPTFTMIAIIAMAVNFDGLTNAKQVNTLIFLGFGMLLLNILIFYLLCDAIEREVRIRKQQLSAERAENEMAMYRQISESFDRQKRREHEYKNEMMVIASLLQRNEIEKLHTLLDKYNAEIAHRTDAIDTNHVIVNAILNTKRQEAREKGIVFVLKVNDLSGLCMEDQDIVVILSNMLNNAIEACEKCSGKRIIKVKAVKEAKTIIFSVVNTIQEAPSLVDGKYRTTKKEEQFHGMGIENVQKIVGKYGGSCAIRYDEEQFYFVVYLSEPPFDAVTP